MLSTIGICENIAGLALRSLLDEVSATPKPGLVDRHNQGAHQDMDFFAFMASSAALVFYFNKCAAKGVEYAGQDAGKLFKSLRGIGQEAETAMFKATGGVNTHKGLIFSLGIVSAAAACCAVEQKTIEVDSICRKAAEMTQGICHDELEGMNKQSGMTHGEKLYRKYGFKGIRGEVESGFATVRIHSLPVLRDLKSKNILSWNDILVQVLLVLMAVNVDTNIAARRDKETLDYVKQYASKVLESGGMFTSSGRQMVYEMDQEFIKKNISPGGSADLLAVTIMFHLICDGEHKHY